MRFYPSILEKVRSGQFFGSSKPIGRVSVEPLWNLNQTPPSYGGSNRGPYRWFQDTADSGVEWEVPNIKNISWDRSESQDIATCTITLYNMWHEGNLEQQELVGQLGKPGYFWPKRGLEVNRWGQIGGTGSFRKDGFWDPNFSWQNVLIQYGMIRTYEGYGGHPTADNFKSIQDNLDDENVLITGTWLIDTVTAGSNGEMVLNCKDMGKLLLEQICFPPTIPSGLYPLDYYPAGKSAFDSVFGPKPKTGVSPGSQGEVRSIYFDSSLDVAQTIASGSPVYDLDIDGHYGSHSNDGNWNTYSLSEAHPLPGSSPVWWEFTIEQGISKMSVKAFAGGYDCYISILRGGVWLDGIGATPGSGIPYVTKVGIPAAIPDNQEPVVNIEMPASLFAPGATTFVADLVRVTFTNLYYSGIPNDIGQQYRGGIRDILFYREGAKADPYSPDFTTIPWTFSMAAHPTRGYWIVDADGSVYGFGDAADYDSTAFGTVPLAATSGHSDNQSIGMCAHPDGKGYWVLDRMGHVYAYGSATHHGEHVVAWPGTDVWGEDGLAAWDIAPTYTGNGYWVCYGDGTIKGFGDATPTDITLPWTDVDIFMNTVVDDKWLIQHQANGIAGHPTKMGFWVTTGCGEVYAYGECLQYGQLDQRVYNRGMADEFRLAKTEFTRSIESTASGNGYWVAFGSGHIAAFGDAVGQGPTFVYPDNNPDINVPIDETNIQDWSFFRALVWDIARDPDGTGFWILVADGHVGSYSAEFWGEPGYNGLTGFRWHEGNFDGDFSTIISELLAWSGFTFYDSSATEVDIFGAIESTGIKTDTIIAADKFDKRSILDIIKELCEVVAYRFLIQEDGSVKISSPNIWRSGNFDVDGIRIYVDGDTYNRVESTDPDAVEFIPIIDEEIDMFEYSTTLSSESMRSEIIIGNDVPDPKNPSSTAFVRHTPRSGSEQVAPGIKMLRDIPRVGMWISQLWQNTEEMQLMAELISLNAWFAERTSTATCVANPCLSLGDQVKFAERNTSEYNIHYISGINSNNDLDTGVWTYNLTSHWLGDADNWVITANQNDAPVDGYHYIQISERVDRWQQATARGLERGGQANGSITDLFSFDGQFVLSNQALSEENWEFYGELTLNTRGTPQIRLDTLTSPLGGSALMKIYQGSSLIITKELTPDNLYHALPEMGVDNTSTTFLYVIEGVPSVTGNGVLGLSMRINQESFLRVSDTLLITN